MLGASSYCIQDSALNGHAGEAGMASLVGAA
jgi:hypothetical protein